MDKGTVKLVGSVTLIPGTLGGYYLWKGGHKFLGGWLLVGAAFGVYALMKM